MPNMDEIDAKQQQEIETLKRVDVKHDTTLRAVQYGGLVLILFVLGMFIVTMMTLDKSSPFACPHKECPHFVGNHH